MFNKIKKVMGFIKDYSIESITCKRAINSKKPGSTTLEVIIKS